MVTKVKQITLCNQASKWKFVWTYKIGLERRGYHQSKVDPYVFYRKGSVILTYFDNFAIVSHKQETITLLK